MRNQYLKKMGITQWQLRQTSAQVEPQLLGWQSCDGLIISTPHNTEENALLYKIAAAIRPDHCIRDKAEMHVCAFVILLGDAAQSFFESQQTISAKKIILSVDLSQLLRDVSAKKTLWMDIKNL